MFLEFATKTIQMDLIAVLRSNRLTVTRHLNRIRVMMEIFPILVIKMLRHIIKNSHQLMKSTWPSPLCLPKNSCLFFVFRINGNRDFKTAFIV
jgi:hypothetical protein